MGMPACFHRLDLALTGDGQKICSRRQLTEINAVKAQVSNLQAL